MRIEVLSFGELIYTHQVDDNALRDFVTLSKEENYNRRQAIINEHIRLISNLNQIKKIRGLEYCLCFESKLNYIENLEELPWINQSTLEPK